MVLWGCPPPGGTCRFPPSLRRSTASKGRFLNPLVVPWLAQHNHPYTSPTRGRASSPRGSGTAPQSRSHGRPPFAPRAGSPRCTCACDADAALRPPSAEAIRAGSALGAGGAGWCRVRGVGGGRAHRRQGRCCRGGGGGGGGGGGCGAPASVGCRGGCTSPAARPAAGAPRSPPPSLLPALPPGPPCPVPPVPWGPRRPCPCPWAPFQPPARAAGPAPRPPRPGPPAHPPPLALPPAPGFPARAPARPSRALVPSRPPALSRAVRCLRSAPPRCCALAPCRACPGLLLARAPGHFPCRLLPPAPRSRGWHAALPARPPLLSGSRARRPAVFAAVAA